MEQDVKQHRATQRVLAVLEQLTAHPEGLTFTELCHALDAPKSSLSPILHTMANSGFIALDEHGARYRVGIKTYVAGRAYDRTDSDMRLLREVVRGVVDACDETAQVGILDGASVLYILRIDSSQPVRLKSEVGTLPAYCTAIGKALLSEKARPDLEALLPQRFERFTDATLRSIDELEPELEAIRRTGFAYDRRETDDAITCVATPVHARGAVGYGLGVSVPAYRFTPEKELLIKQALSSARTELERALS